MHFLNESVHCMFQHKVHWCWSKCVQITDQDHVTMNHRGLYQMYLSISAPKLKKKDFVKCVISVLYKYGF